MPELPEVETVIKGISSSILGQTINKCELSLKKLRYPITRNFKKIILSTKVTSISRRAKYILINLSNSKTIIIHLGMSGRIILTSNNENSKFKHTHMTLYFKNNLIAKILIQEDLVAYYFLILKTSVKIDYLVIWDLSH